MMMDEEKTIKVSCKTCASTCSDRETKECLSMQYSWWTPNNEVICVGCPMHGRSKQCCRHAEPCFRRYDMEMEIEIRTYTEELERLGLFIDKQGIHRKRCQKCASKNRL